MNNLHYVNESLTNSLSCKTRLEARIICNVLMTGRQYSIFVFSCVGYFKYLFMT